MELDFTKTHPFIGEYLRYVENTETPRIMHVWAALSGISACLGRRCYYNGGIGIIYPNMYILLVGPPAVRKSTAFVIMTKLLRKGTGVRFAPDDTGGQRQGLLSAMMGTGGGLSDTDKEIIDALAKNTKDLKENNSYTSLSDLADTVDALGNINLDTRDPQTLLIAASELNSILGEGNTALLTFLQKMYDGDRYEYKLKSTTHAVENGLLGIIGATTPQQISVALPHEAVGQGFTSRCIFVYADQKHRRKIARPTLDLEIENELVANYSRIFETFTGEITETKEAASFMDRIYERGIPIQDPRFVYYADRRHTHLQKLSMVLAASGNRKQIDVIDVQFADQLLLYTEQFMSDALGEYGMSKLSAAKQRLMEMIKHSDEAISVNVLFAAMFRDMTKHEFETSLVELHNAKKISKVVIQGKDCVIAVSDNAARQARRDIDQIAHLMVAKG